MLNLFNRVSKIRNVLITFFFLTQVRVPLIWVTLDALCGTMLPLTGQSSTLNNWQLTVHFFLISHILQIGVRDEYHRLRQKGMEWWPPAAGTCRSWWTLARGGPAVCESWRTATGPGWWQVASGCGCPACEPSEGPAWTAAAVVFFLVGGSAVRMDQIWFEVNAIVSFLVHGSPAWAGQCNEHPRRRVSLLESHQSPGWLRSCATKKVQRQRL